MRLELPFVIKSFAYLLMLLLFNSHASGERKGSLAGRQQIFLIHIIFYFFMMKA